MWKIFRFFKVFVLPFDIFYTIYMKGKFCCFFLSRPKNDTFLSKKCAVLQLILNSIGFCAI